MKKIKITLKKNLVERLLLLGLSIYGVATFMQMVSQWVVYQKIHPNLDQIEIGALLLYITNLRLIGVEFLLCVGFILIYLAIKNGKKQKRE